MGFEEGLKMEDMVEDDFGELYADVELQASSAINGTLSEAKLYIKEEEGKIKEERSSSEQKVASNSGDSNVVEETKVLVEKVKEEVEEEEEEEGLDNGSESEDDLLIVLNEDDCETKTEFRGFVRNGSDEEEDNFEGDRDGLQQISCHGAERGSLPKGGYRSQHSQYKYIRPQKAPFSSSFRGDWDVNACIPQMGSNSGPVASSCTPFLGIAQSGLDFFLPRHRTIFDVNIDMFENKPWRHPGVDITDFFNFGFDEERWKQYCNQLEQLRQQTTMPTKMPVYGSSRENQVYEAEFDCQAVGSEAVTGGIAQSERQPKGRAIEVEGGIGERRPSMDIRRPRNRDSDVVIQIAVQDFTEFSSNSSKEEPGKLDNSKLDVSENGCSGPDVNRDEHSMDIKDELNSCTTSSIKYMEGRSLKRCSKPKAESDALRFEADGRGNGQIPAVDGRPHQRAKEDVCEETSEAIQTANITDGSFSDQIQLSSDSRVEGSKGKVNLGKEKHKKLTKRTSSNSVTCERVPVVSDCYPSKDSGSSDGKTETRDGKHDSGNQNHVREEQDYSSRVKLRSVAELKIPTDEVRATSRSSKKDWYDANHLTKRHNKRKERHCDHDFYKGKDLAYCRETEVSIGHCSGGFAEKPVREPYSDGFHGKRRVDRRDEMDPHIRRQWDEKEYFLERRVARDNEVKQRERSLHEGFASRGMSDGGHRGSAHVTSENPFHSDKERHHWQRRKINDEHWLRRETQDDDFVLEHKYREEYVQGSFNYSSEMEYYEEKYDKHVSYKNSDRRDRYGGSPHLSRSMLHEDEYREYPDHELSPHKEFHFANRSGWHDMMSPRNALNDSRRSDGDLGHRKRSHSDKHRNYGWSDPTCDDNHDPDDYFCDDRRGYSRQSKAFGWPDEKTSSRFWERGRIFAEEASFSYERSSRLGAIDAKHDPTHSRIVLDEYRLERKRKRTIREENGTSVLNTRIISNLDVIEKDKDEQADLRCKESVDFHLVGWEEKSSERRSNDGGARSHTREAVNHVINREHWNMEEKTFRQFDKLHSSNVTPTNIPKINTNRFRSISSKVEKVWESQTEHPPHGSNGTFFDKYPLMHHHKRLALEEGQLPLDAAEFKDANPPETKWCSNKTIPNGVSKEKNPSAETADESKTVGGYDNNHILQTLAKMEKRRERFKAPIAVKEPDKNPKSEQPHRSQEPQAQPPQPPQPDITIETTEVEQQRPARKRRWGGS